MEQYDQDIKKLKQIQEKAKISLSETETPFLEALSNLEQEETEVY